MPANLNALIRYKTINSCLSNPHRKWKIRDLTEACSGALREHRGIDSGVSERTIRDDIRILRSDILGFNAPIVQKDGDYSYADPSYSIFQVEVRDAALLKRILEFLQEIKDGTLQPGLDEIIESLLDVLAEEELKADERMKPDISKLDSFLSEAPVMEEHYLVFRPDAFGWKAIFRALT